MELNTTLMSLQSVLMRICKTTDSLRRIKYKNGNEMKISTVVNEMKKFLEKEKCLVNSELNREKENVIRDVVFFLVLNCEYKEELEMKGYEHLMGIKLKISKCLFANIITELNLVSAFACNLEKLPLNIQTELLEEVFTCLQKGNTLTLSFVTDVLTAAVKQINVQVRGDDGTRNEDVENLVLILVEILKVLKGVDVDRLTALQPREIYREMGYKFLRLLQLLLLCDPTKEHFAPLIKNIIPICSDVIKAVTIEVYCEWAEVEEQEEPLQLAVATAAYYVTQKYQDCEITKNFLKMLSNFARKPLSVHELIKQADTAKMVQMIEKGDKNQKQWFKALFRTEVFSDENVMACIEKHLDLCGENEVSRLLSFCGGKEVDQRKLDLILKCAFVIPLEELVILVIRHFWSYGIHTPLNRNYNKERLVVLLNKMEDNDDFFKEILLLLLQNLKEVLLDLYRECLRNTMHSNHLKKVFTMIQKIVVVGGASVICLEALINEQVLLENHQQLIALIKVLLETECINHNNAINDLIVPLLKKFSDEANPCLLYSLKILNEIYCPNVLTTLEVLLTEIFTTLEKLRGDFYKFSPNKQESISQCVQFLCKCNPCTFEPPVQFAQDSVNQYYVRKICYDVQESLFNCIFPNYYTEDYYKFVCVLTNVLPSCVGEEWKEIALALQSKSGTKEAVKTLTDVLILLSHVLKNQNEDPTIVAAFKYCLNNYMISVKALQQSDLLDQIAIAKTVCRLLRGLPEEIIEENGLIITGLVTNEALKELSNNKEFVCSVVAIGNKNVCKSLACKMMK